MTEVRFYHLQHKTLEQALPQLLTKVLEQGQRAVVVAGSQDRVDALNQHLWTFDPASFLPHGAAADGFAADQPIWLSTCFENPNRAQVLVLVDGAGAERFDGFDRVCDLFDGNDPLAVAAARSRWRACKGVAVELSYWQQGERGGWEKKG